ncbi:type II toxin-antitoxin system RelE/ParE family toxin [Rhizobium sp. RAF36]|uniref:type II toxin-antitoxin system RelE/ParE family toxin n=1 Tax=Rhizobium sp. RAF36 TaxID=3233055 RepID=UPI003F9A90E8
MIVKWTTQARHDRNRQIHYISEKNPRAALAQGDLVLRNAAMLGEHPRAGRPGRQPGTRELVVPQTPFVIIYRVDENAQEIQILRLLRGAQQWPPD